MVSFCSQNLVFIEQNGEAEFVSAPGAACEFGNGCVVTEPEFENAFPESDECNYSVGVAESVAVPQASENRADSCVSAEV